MPLVSIADLNQPIGQIEPYIELARQLSRMYDEMLEIDIEPPGHRAPGLHASELSRCVRMTYYSAVPIEKQKSTSAKMQRKFDIGHAVHALTQRDLHRLAAIHQAEELARKNGWYLEFEDEVPVSPRYQELARKYRFHSSCDGVFTFREAANAEPILRVGLEIKTENPDSYDELKAPKEDHIKQTHIYMAALDLPLMWFFYMNKGNQNTTPSYAPWLIPFDSKVWNELEMRAQEVLDHVAQGMAPRREEGFHCTFCPYSWECQPPSLIRKNTKRISVRRSTP